MINNNEIDSIRDAAIKLRGIDDFLA